MHVFEARFEIGDCFQIMLKALCHFKKYGCFQARPDVCKPFLSEMPVCCRDVLQLEYKGAGGHGTIQFSLGKSPENLGFVFFSLVHCLCFSCSFPVWVLNSMLLGQSAALSQFLLVTSVLLPSLLFIL